MAAAMVAASSAFAPGLGFLPAQSASVTAVMQRPPFAHTKKGWAAGRRMPALRVSMLGANDVAMDALSAKVDGVEISTVRRNDLSHTKLVRPPIGPRSVSGNQIPEILIPKAPPGASCGRIVRRTCAAWSCSLASIKRSKVSRPERN